MRPESLHYLFTALYQFGLGATMTVYTPFLVRLGIPYDDIAILNIVFSVALFFLEVPTGAIADRYGRATSVAIGAFFVAVGGFSYALCTGFWSVLFTELVCGLGFACISGAQDAWMYDALNCSSKEERDHRTHDVRANAYMLRSVSIVLGNLCAVYLVPSFEETVAFVLMGLLAGLACVFAFIWMRPLDVASTVTEQEALALAVQKLRSSSILMWAFTMTFMMGSMVNMNLYWVVFMRTRLSIAEIGWLSSFLVAGPFVSSAIARSAIGQYLRHGKSHVIGMTIASITLGAFTNEQATWMWAALLIVNETGRGIYHTLHETFINEHIEAKYRATFGSMSSFVGSLGCAVTLMVTTVVFYGRDSDPSVIPTLWLGTSLVCLTGTAALWRLRPR